MVCTAMAGEKSAYIGRGSGTWCVVDCEGVGPPCRVGGEAPVGDGV